MIFVLGVKDFLTSMKSVVISVGNNGKPWLNDSGCPDPTAYEAMKRIQNEERRHIQTDLNSHSRLVITTIKNILDLSGFELVDRIQIRHKKTGKIFK